MNTLYPTTPTVTPEPSGLKIVARKPVETERNARYTHRVPSTLLPLHRQQIVCEVRAGRSIFDTARVYQTTTAVVAELWLRNLDKRVSLIGRVA